MVFIAVAIFAGKKFFGGVIKHLVGRVKKALLLVVDGERVEKQLSSGGLILLPQSTLKLNDIGIHFFGIVRRIGNQSHLVGVDGIVVAAAESLGNAEKVGVGIDVDQAINDCDVLVVGVKVDFGAASANSYAGKDDKRVDSLFYSIIVLSVKICC